MWPFKNNKRLLTTLPPSHPINYLGVDCDPVVLYLPGFGQVLLLIEAPAPEFISTQKVYEEGRKLFDLTDADVVPSYYYKREVDLDGYIR